MLIKARIEHPYASGVWIAARNEVPLAEHSTIKIRYRQLFEVFGVDLSEKPGRKLRHRSGLVRRQTRIDLLNDRIDLHGQSLQLRLFHLAPLLLISSRQDADRRRRSAWRESVSHHRGINVKARRRGAKAEPAFSLGQRGLIFSIVCQHVQVMAGTRP